MKTTKAKAKKSKKKYTKSVQERMDYMDNRAILAEDRLKELANEYIKEAKQAGVQFIVKLTKGGLYCVSVKGEEGSICVSLQRLPAMIHGLFVQGGKVRELFWQMQKC